MAEKSYPHTLNAGLAMLLQQTPVRVDAGIVVGAASSPWWLPYVEAVSTVASAVMWTALFILTAIRIAIAYRDWRRGK